MSRTQAKRRSNAAATGWSDRSLGPVRPVHTSQHALGPVRPVPSDRSERLPEQPKAETKDITSLKNFTQS